jgi:hypothetical protein
MVLLPPQRPATFKALVVAINVIQNFYRHGMGTFADGQAAIAALLSVWLAGPTK